MAGLKEKTPVSYLQEYLVAQQIIPHYELVYNGVGTHNPLFTYRVEAKGIKEEGTGRSKREAKHRAAEKMLKSLEVTDCAAVVDEEEIDKSNVEPAENYVGQVKELCLIKGYPEPKYFLEEAAGPPHSRIFKMICCVSQLQEYGVSTTKKQAKHKAAWKMLERLKEYMVDETFKLDGSENPQVKKAVNDEEVLEKYNMFRPSTAVTAVNKDPVVFYKDHHKAYIGLQKTSPTLYKVANTPEEEMNNQDSVRLINDIAQELEVSVSQLTVPSKESKKPFTVMSLSLLPPIASIGESKQKAALNLLESLLFLSAE